MTFEYQKKAPDGMIVNIQVNHVIEFECDVSSNKVKFKFITEQNEEKTVEDAYKNYISMCLR